MTTVSSYRGLDDSLYAGRPVELEVAAGEIVAGLRIVLMRAGGGGFRVNGAVRGVELSSRVTNFVRFRGFGSAARRLQTGVLAREVNADGTFAFDKIPEGRYVLTLQQVRAASTPGEQRRPERFMLGALDVAGDIEGLLLVPLPPTGIRGRIAYREAPLGKPVLLALQGAGGAFAQILVENAAGGAFANLQLLPDRYTIRSFGAGAFRPGGSRGRRAFGWQYRRSGTSAAFAICRFCCRGTLPGSPAASKSRKAALPRPFTAWPCAGRMESPAFRPISTPAFDSRKSRPAATRFALGPMPDSLK